MNATRDMLSSNTSFISHLDACENKLGRAQRREINVLHPTGSLQVSWLSGFAQPFSELAMSSRSCIFSAASFERFAASSTSVVSVKQDQVTSFPETRSISVRIASSRAVSRRVAVASASAARTSQFSFLRSTSLPNNALVPTANRHAPVGSRSQSTAPAAQRGRSALHDSERLRSGWEH